MIYTSVCTWFQVSFVFGVVKGSDTKTEKNIQVNIWKDLVIKNILAENEKNETW